MCAHGAPMGPHEVTLGPNVLSLAHAPPPWALQMGAAQPRSICLRLSLVPQNQQRLGNNVRYLPIGEMKGFSLLRPL